MSATHFLDDDPTLRQISSYIVAGASIFLGVAVFNTWASAGKLLAGILALALSIINAGTALLVGRDGS